MALLRNQLWRRWEHLVCLSANALVCISNRCCEVFVLVHLGSGSFPRFLEAKGIRGQFKPGGTPYCVMGELWRTNREVNHEFQGFKTMELENAAKMEELHADHIRKLVRVLCPGIVCATTVLLNLPISSFILLACQHI